MKLPEHLTTATEAELEQLAENIDKHPDWYSVTRDQVDAALFQLRHKAQPPAGWHAADSAPPPDGTSVLCWRRHPSDITRGQFFVASAWGRGRGAGRHLEWTLEVGTEHDSTSPDPEPTHWASFATI